MRLLVASLICLFVLDSFAGEKENIWDARVLSSGCNVTLHFTKTFSQFDCDVSDPLRDVGFYISSPNSKYIGDGIKLLKKGEVHLVLLIQPFLHFNSSEKGIVFTNPPVKTLTSTYKTSSSTFFRDPNMPGFVLAGDSVQIIWEQIVEKKPVSVQFELSTGAQYSIEIKGARLDQVSRMLAACIG